MPERARSLGWLFAPVGAIVLIDVITKQLALSHLFFPPRAIEVLPFLNLVPVWNPGISFGLLQNEGGLIPLLLTGFAVLIGIGLPIYARNWEPLARLGAQGMAGGAFGNAIDRVLYGKVVDFIDLYAGQWHWPAFNVADMAITGGAGLILLSGLVESRRDHRGTRAGDGTSEGDGKE